jgi:hypothetical protein
VFAAVASFAAVFQVGVNAEDLAQQVILRTRSTHATYFVVTANEIHRDDGTIHEFAAEFNQGDFHRVETPRDRIVANCRTGWSAHLNLASGKISHGDQISGSVCGIDPTAIVEDRAITGSRQSQFGLLQQLRIVRVDGTRNYEVAPNGAIVGETLADVTGKVRLVERAILLSDHLPAADIFSEASLARSVVSDQLKKEASEPK